MSQMESEAYNDGSSEEDFMEQAGKGAAELVHEYCEAKKTVKHIILICGSGNNAGDAYVVGRYLLRKNYKVFAYQIDELKECTPLTQKNYSQFTSKGGVVHKIISPKEVTFPDEGIIVDGIFGTGFHGIAKEPYATVINKSNQSGLPIISLDIPSGVNGNTGVVEGPAIFATETIFLGLPKLGFFLEDGWNHVGNLRYVDFGLPKKYIDQISTNYTMLTPELTKPLLPKLVKNRHKYQAGFVVGVAGSPGMPGAAIMSSISSLRSGAGIVRLLHPKGMENELASSPPEIIRVSYTAGDYSKVNDLLNTATACFIGPGIGKTPASADLVKSIFKSIHRPCVIDADALTIMAEEKLSPPKNSILTPHAGEMMKLLKKSTPKPASADFIHTCQEYANEKHVTLVLKGGPSFIFHPGESVRINPYGDPGMATAGSGDVLTGLIAGLLAQGLTPHQAATLGVYIHGIAGEHAAAQLTSYCMIATDILAHFPAAFRDLSLTPV